MWRLAIVLFLVLANAFFDASDFCAVGARGRQSDPTTATAYMWRLAIVLFLVLANAFFFAAEFALVGARRSKIDQMAASGDRLAKAAQRAIKDLDRYISATQLGITLASLGLGWIGEPA